MTDSPNQANRAQILNGIRRSLRRGELSGANRQAAEMRLAEPPLGPAPFPDLTGAPGPTQARTGQTTSGRH